MARRRRTPGQIITKLREAGVALAQGLVGGAGLQGAWGDGADVLPLAQEGCGGMRVAQAKRPGQLEGRKTRGRGRAVADLTVANQTSGGSGRGKLRGPDASAEGRHAGAAGVGGLGASGLSGVGPTPVPLSATVLVHRTTGAAP